MLIQNDGGNFKRYCTKLCTGGGKTIVMAMLIAWSVCNKVRDIRNMNSSRNILIIAPNLTVKKRLQVLRPNDENNYYERFDIVPAEMQELVSQARIVIHNWQALSWDSSWIQGLDRINEVRKILTCYDFSATPFISGGKTSEERLFSLMVSDFSLSDGIESGLVKTPRVVVKDNVVPDANTYKSELYHIYSNDKVKNALKNSASIQESLPDLVRQAYVILSSDWKEIYKQWQESGKKIPPKEFKGFNKE